jgi:hypothetical protein
MDEWMTDNSDDDCTDDDHGDSNVARSKLIFITVNMIILK